MPTTSEVVAGVSSTIVRLGTYGFLQWIPGHHFPPVILASLAIYLLTVFTQSDNFGTHRPTLAEAFPKVFKHRKQREKANGQVETVATPPSDEQPILYDDEKPILKIFLLGIPQWREWEFSYITILVNILLGLATLDLVFRGPTFHPAHDLRFSRVGFVDATSAKVLFREPDSTQLPVYVYLKRNDSTIWIPADRVYNVDETTDFTYPLAFTGLLSETDYTYSLSNNLTGTFTTAAAPLTPASNTLTFLTSSCIKANFPYRPLSHSLAIHGFKCLSKLVQSLPKPPAFMLFVGDFIYVDVPRRLSSSVAHYRSEYRRVYASPSWSLPGLSSLPWLHSLDDHEIANDWSSGNKTQPFPAASDPFLHYHVSVNPPVPGTAPNEADTNTTYFQFTNGPAEFFMLDTRRYRTDPEAQSTSQNINLNPDSIGSSDSAFFSSTPKRPTYNHPHTMLGHSQLHSLLTFLRTPPAGGRSSNIHWKIIASSVPFTKNWRFGTSDTWGGFPHERSIVLEAMHAAERDLGIRVVVLSGDRHEFAAIRFPPPVLRMPVNTNAGRHAARNAPGASSDINAKAVAEAEKLKRSRLQMIAGGGGPGSGGRAARHANDIKPASLIPQRRTQPTLQKDTIVYDRTPQSGPHEFSVGPLSMFYLPFRTFKQVDEEDVAIQYLPDGNSKVGVVEITNLAAGRGAAGAAGGALTADMAEEGQQKSVLKYSLFVDGVVTWEYILSSPAPAYGKEKSGRNEDSPGRSGSRGWFGW